MVDLQINLNMMLKAGLEEKAENSIAEIIEFMPVDSKPKCHKKCLYSSANPFYNGNKEIKVEFSLKIILIIDKY